MKTISAQIPDAELSALVAEHMAGWTHNPHGGLMPPDLPAAFNIYQGFKFPEFATSADAVLPLLEQLEDHAVRIDWNRGQGCWQFLTMCMLDNQQYIYRHPSYARCACMVLLSSRGFTITP